jgi:hypothetical protein
LPASGDSHGPTAAPRRAELKSALAFALLALGKIQGTSSKSGRWFTLDAGIPYQVEQGKSGANSEPLASLRPNFVARGEGDEELVSSALELLILAARAQGPT